MCIPLSSIDLNSRANFIAHDPVLLFHVKHYLAVAFISSKTCAKGSPVSDCQTSMM